MSEKVVQKLSKSGCQNIISLFQDTTRANTVGHGADNMTGGLIDSP